MRGKELLWAFLEQAALQVYVVTAEHEGTVGALTASSVIPVSFEPPRMLASIEKRARSHAAFLQARGFVIHLLAEDEVKIAEIMSSKLTPAEKLEAVGYERSPYGPVIKGAKSYLLLEKHAMFDAGDHTLFVGNVVEGRVGLVRRPLLYYSTGFTGVRA
ncbi:MAG: flavin reductase family protein [Acidilobaceae archaeon]|nr:flavin reductase family protein [Acidilobaceae archaeon]MCX8166139.1 flavin reductase family protein [Acidilobaceae archaeon]MDW7974777.1 flavin reductase family protein [Sulfolobales archaeon]